MVYFSINPEIQENINEELIQKIIQIVNVRQHIDSRTERVEFDKSVLVQGN